VGMPLALPWTCQRSLACPTSGALPPSSLPAPSASPVCLSLVSVYLSRSAASAGTPCGGAATCRVCACACVCVCLAGGGQPLRLMPLARCCPSPGQVAHGTAAEPAPGPRGCCGGPGPCRPGGQAAPSGKARAQQLAGEAVPHGPARPRLPVRHALRRGNAAWERAPRSRRVVPPGCCGYAARGGITKAWAVYARQPHGPVASQQPHRRGSVLRRAEVRVAPHLAPGHRHARRRRRLAGR
jgi:hypothetical protein